jgi:hypothetical protein
MISFLTDYYVYFTELMVIATIYSLNYCDKNNVQFIVAYDKLSYMDLNNTIRCMDNFTTNEIDNVFDYNGLTFTKTSILQDKYRGLLATVNSSAILQTNSIVSTLQIISAKEYYTIEVNIAYKIVTIARRLPRNKICELVINCENPSYLTATVSGYKGNKVYKVIVITKHLTAHYYVSMVNMIKDKNIILTNSMSLEDAGIKALCKFIFL